jgi:hypothetical protein
MKSLQDILKKEKYKKLNLKSQNATQLRKSMGSQAILY